MNEKLKELKWLYDMGLALHRLYPHSKLPIGKNWSQGPRKDWKVLAEEIEKDDNFGVRTGLPSRLTDGSYLIILDVDVKSTDPEDAKEAYRVAELFIGKKLDKVPTVLSGRGGASRHFYVRSKTAHNSFNLVRSAKRVKAKMPSVPAGKKEHELLTPDEMKAGYRLRPAFEIDIYGTGKQAAIPPSIHPDTHKAYKWQSMPTKIDDIPLVAEASFKDLRAEPLAEGKNAVVEFKDVDVMTLKLSTKALDLILEMKGLDAYAGDRSSALFGVIAEMCLKRIDDSTIVSVLTDPMHAIAEVVIDRVGSSFDKAARWLLPQISKMKSAHGAEAAFSDEVSLMADTDWALPSTGHAEAGEAIRDSLGGWEIELDKTQQGGIKMNLKNVCLYLRHECAVTEWLGQNLFTGEIEFVGSPPWDKKKAQNAYTGRLLSDEDVIEGRLYLSKREKFEPPTHLMLEGLIACARLNSFHPVCDWLRTLNWDGKPRLDNWLPHYMRAKSTPYTRAIGKKLLVAAVSRVMRPGCKFDHVMILEGAQDIMKSTTLRVLSEPWFCDSLGDVTNKDVIQQIQGSWIVEIPELSSMDRASVNALKEFITKQEDKARLAYQRLAKKFPRQCVLVGTTNDDEYLKDTTGNRRFWPVNVGTEGELRISELRRDKEQLWAEAVHVYDEGLEPLWLEDKGVKAESEAVQRDKMIADPLENQIIEIVEKMKPKGVTKGASFRFKLEDVWVDLGNRSSTINRPNQLRIAGTLRKIGAKKLKTNQGVFWEGTV